ncbi:MAG: branched-chain amino acid ABC transporter substrate-binding protein, partial [Actinobacteria bacterium]|nr:branched-chain amino acid ABC transporter substrate-binding protein [Actinomycetota bacterium]
MRAITKTVAILAALVLVAGACSKSSGGGTTNAGSCTASKLKGFALGSSDAAKGTTFSVAGHIAMDAKPIVKIGMFGDLTGSASALVKPILNAAELAIAQANQKGTDALGKPLKVQIQLYHQDNKDHKADTAVPIEQKFIDDSKVLGVIGGAFSGETGAVGGKFAAAGLAHITASATAPDLTSHGWPFFRTVVTDAVQGAKMADTLYVLGCRKAAVIDDKEDYGAGLADAVKKEFESKGGTVVDREG